MSFTPPTPAVPGARPADPSAGPAAITAAGLRKTYPAGRGKSPVRALDGLSFEAAPGTVFALLGPNGAGKSTTVKILATLSRADSGLATVAGIDVARHPDRVRRAIGYVAQKPVTDPMDTGRENLVLAGRMQGLTARDAKTRAAELLERFSLTDAANRLVKTYSGGMARKLDVAMGLMHRPSVLFLDEPTTGLDPQARAEMWAEIERMTTSEEMTVLLTTHYLEEADRLAANLAIVDHGRVVIGGTPEELKDELRGDAVVVELAGSGGGGAGPAAGRVGSGGRAAEEAGSAGRAAEEAGSAGQAGVGPDAVVARAAEIVARVAGLSDVFVDGRLIRARAVSGAVALPAVIAALEGAGIDVAAASLARPSLDDVYLKYTGRTFAASDTDAGSASGSAGSDPASGSAGSDPASGSAGSHPASGSTTNTTNSTTNKGVAA